MPINVLRLGFLGLDCVRYRESKDYYTKVVGLPLIAEKDRKTYLGCGFGSHAVSLHAADRPGVRHIGLQLAGDGPLEDVVATLRAGGVAGAIKPGDLHGVQDVVEIVDPDGLRLLLYRTEEMAVSHFPACGIRPEKLGHAAFWVADAKRSERFYSEVLGFRTSDWIDQTFVFMRCNTDHHTLNFLTAPYSSLFHFAFELRDASHLVQSCDVLGKEKLRIEWGPGRHGPGHNLYTYHRDPDGNIVELFAELDIMRSESLGYFDPRPYHRDSPQRPKTWVFSPGIDIWGAPPPPDFQPLLGDVQRPAAAPSGAASEDRQVE